MWSSGEEDEEAGAVPDLNPQPPHPVAFPFKPYPSLTLTSRIMTVQVTKQALTVSVAPPGGNPAPRPVPNHPFMIADPLTQEQFNQAPEITSQGDTKSVHIELDRHGLVVKNNELDRHGIFTRTALRNDLLAYQRPCWHIFELQHPNLLRNIQFWRSDEAHVNLHKFKAIISEEVVLAFEYAHLDNTVYNRGHRKRVWAADLARAVMFLHSRNTVHGCIELSRIFLDTAGILKLHLIPYNLIPRTRNANYTAREVRDGLAPTKESDVYSTAAVEYFILEEQEPPLDKSRLHFTSAPPGVNLILVRAFKPRYRPSVQQIFNALRL